MHPGSYDCNPDDISLQQLPVSFSSWSDFQTRIRWGADDNISMKAGFSPASTIVTTMLSGFSNLTRSYYARQIGRIQALSTSQRLPRTRIALDCMACSFLTSLLEAVRYHLTRSSLHMQQPQEWSY